MSEAGAIGARPTGSAAGMSPVGEFASQTGAMTNVGMATETQTTSVSGFVSQSSTTVRSEFNDQMAALVMALIDMLFGKDDDEDKQKKGLLALLAMAGGMQAQSSSSYVAFQQSSSSNMLTIEQTVSTAYGQVGDAMQGGAAASMGGGIDVSG